MRKLKLNNEKRKYEERLLPRLSARDEFLVERLKNEWDEIQKSAKRERIVQKTKEGGIIMAKAILTLLVIAGGLTVIAVAPNIFAAAGAFSRRRGFFDERKFRRSVSYLKTKKFVEIKSGSKNGLEIDITGRGRDEILKKSFDDLKIHADKSWDGLWRIVAFDIPDKNRWSRDGLRSKLKEMGFFQLQKSLFAIPYDCKDEIEFIAEIYGVGPHIKFIIANSVSNDSELRDFFQIGN